MAKTKNAWVPAHGESISVPKGTTVYDTGWWPMEGEPSKRTVTGKVETVWDMAQDHQWQRFVTDEEKDHLWAACAAAGLTAHWPFMGNWRSNLPAFQQVKDRIFALHDGDLRFVSWGGRMAHISDVHPAEAKTPKEQASTLRTVLTRGSTWETTRDLTITGLLWSGYIDNPKYAGEFGYKGPEPIREDQETVKVPLLHIPAGTSFTVRDVKNKALGHGNGLGVPVEINNEDVTWTIKGVNQLGNPLTYNGLFLPINQIEGAIRMLEGTVETAFVLRDTDTGTYFAGFTHDWANNKSHLRMVETLTSARKYSSIHAAKSSIKAWTGQVEHHSGGSAPEWVGWEKTMDLPATWELLELDRASGKTSLSIDIQAWHQEQTRTKTAE